VQLTIGVFKFAIDPLSSGVTKRIDQRFPSNAVNLLPDGWSQWLLATFDADAKVQTGLGGNFLTNGGQSRNQIQWTRARTETLNGIPGLPLSPAP